MFYEKSSFNIDIFEKIVATYFKNDDILVFIDYTKEQLQFEFYDTKRTFNTKKWFNYTINTNNSIDFIKNDLKTLSFVFNHCLYSKKKLILITDFNFSIEFFKEYENIKLFSLDIFQKKIIKTLLFEYFFNTNYFSKPLLEKKNIFETFSKITSFYNFNFLYKERQLNHFNNFLKFIDKKHLFKDEKEYQILFSNDKKEFAKKCSLDYYHNYNDFITTFTVSKLPDYKNISKVIDVVVPLKENNTNKKVLAIFHPNSNVLNYFSDKIVLISEDIFMKILFNNHYFLQLNFNYKTNIKLLLNYALFSKSVKIVLKQNCESFYGVFYNEYGIINEVELTSEMFYLFYDAAVDGFIKEKRNCSKQIKFKLKKCEIEDNKFIIIDRLNTLDTSLKNEHFTTMENKILETIKELEKTFHLHEIGYFSEFGSSVYIHKIVYLGKNYNKEIMEQFGIKKSIVIKNNEISFFDL